MLAFLPNLHDFKQSSARNTKRILFTVDAASVQVCCSMHVRQSDLIPKSVERSKYQECLGIYIACKSNNITDEQIKKNQNGR